MFMKAFFTQFLSPSSLYNGAQTRVAPGVAPQRTRNTRARARTMSSVDGSESLADGNESMTSRRTGGGGDGGVDKRPSKPVGKPIRLRGKPPKNGIVPPAHVVMFSGCKDDQESADVSNTVRGKGGARWGFSTGHTVGAAGGSAFDVFFFFNQEREGGCLVDCLLTGFLTMMMCFATIDRLEPLRRG